MTDPFIGEISGYVDLPRLTAYQNEGLIVTRSHPSGKLLIHNYTERCAYHRKWDEVTLACRGLITDVSGKLIARPFPKSFNIEEHTPEQILALDGLPFTATTKMDGSLGILYIDPDTNKPAIATRGSFISPQAVRATEMLRTLYPQSERWNRVLPFLGTLLFEIIYPENRIVVDYKGESKLVLLAGIWLQSGEDMHRSLLELVARDFGYPLVEQVECKDWRTLRDAYADTENHEGFVFAFRKEDGTTFRMKAKLSQYVRLHRLLTKVDERSIWDVLRNGESLDAFLVDVPDEFYDWVRSVETQLITSYNAIEAKCRADFSRRPWDIEVPAGSNHRKEIAAYFNTCTYPKVLFAMLDNKDYKRVIWKLVEPKGDAHLGATRYTTGWTA